MRYSIFSRNKKLSRKDAKTGREKKRGGNFRMTWLIFLCAFAPLRELIF
jgi:hypothetical protein